MIVTSVQIKTAKTQKHLYCLVFTKDADLFQRLFSLGRKNNTQVVCIGL